MARHTVAAAPPDEPRAVRWRRLAVRAAEALALGAAAGVGAWAASTWVGTTRPTAVWVGLAAGLLTAVTTWAAPALTRTPTAPGDESRSPRDLG